MKLKLALMLFAACTVSFTGCGYEEVEVGEFTEVGTSEGKKSDKAMEEGTLAPSEPM